MMVNISMPNFSLDTTMYAAFIGAVVSFIVWALTIITEGLRKRSERKRINKSNLTFLSSLLLGAISTSNQQNKLLKEYIEQFNDVDNDYSPLHSLPNPDLKTISEKIDQEKYFNSYLDIFKNNRLNIERFKIVFSTAYFLDIQYQKMGEMSNKFYDYEHLELNRFANTFQSALNEIGKLPHMELDNVSTAFFQDATNQMEIYSKTRESRADFRAALDAFILPFLSTIALKYSTLELAIEIGAQLHSAKSISEKVRLHRLSYQAEMSFVFNTLLEAVNELKSNSMILIEKFTPESN